MSATSVAVAIGADADLAIITDRDDLGVEVIRHSAAHLLAQAVKQLFPSAQVTIGPVIEDGFYYDFAFERAFTPEDLESIEARMAALAAEAALEAPRASMMAAPRCWNVPMSESTRFWRPTSRPPCRLMYGLQ